MQPIQTMLTTALFREVGPLQIVRRLLGRPEPLSILSFGCSRGDELITLRSLFPNDGFKGVTSAPQRSLRR